MVLVKAALNISGLIHQVSTQNILMGLNAAIEEARAIEEEEGFSLVADEVRRIVKC